MLSTYMLQSVAVSRRVFKLSSSASVVTGETRAGAARTRDKVAALLEMGARCTRLLSDPCLLCICYYIGLNEARDGGEVHTAE